MKGVSITDYAVICATGRTTKTATDRIFAGESGLTQHDGRFVGRVVEPLAPLPDLLAEFDTRQARLALQTALQISVSIKHAIEKWGPTRVAVLIGTSTGGIEWVENHYIAGTSDTASTLVGSAFTRHSFGAVPQVLQRCLGLGGPAYAISTACSSSSHILGSAARMIKGGRVDAVLAVGVDTLCELTLQGFHGLGLLAKSMCHPFDSARDGINIGEAGAAILLEKGDANAEFRLRGFGASSDGYHMTRPPADGAGAVIAMRAALEDAGITPAEVAGIHTHGTGTIENDRAESNAIAAVFGDWKSVVSTKGATGHTLGACGALNAILSVESLKRQCLPATVGLHDLDPSMRVRAEASARSISGNFVASNSFAFGGNNATVIVERCK